MTTLELKRRWQPTHPKRYTGLESRPQKHVSTEIKDLSERCTGLLIWSLKACPHTSDSSVVASHGSKTEGQTGHLAINHQFVTVVCIFVLMLCLTGVWKARETCRQQSMSTGTVGCLFIGSVCCTTPGIWDKQQQPFSLNPMTILKLWTERLLSSFLLLAHLALLLGTCKIENML